MAVNGLEFEKPIIELEKRIEELKSFASTEDIDFSDEIKVLEKKAVESKKRVYKNLTAWQRMQIARHPDRPYTLDYINALMKNFIELHGDRSFADDQAIIGGLASFQDKTVMVIGHQRGRNTKENLYRNFGMPYPEGYRKILRLMKTAEKFSIPIISFVDTPGAYPGIEAEERGQSEAIARSLKEMAHLQVPTIVIITGEGGSGGALAIGLGNKVFMLENAVYFVCTPESCGAILWKDRAKAPEAAEALCITASDLKKFKVIDAIIPEPVGGAHRNPAEVTENIKNTLKTSLSELAKLSPEEISNQRYEKYRKIGKFLEK
ncbi:acetyl-CoA carboxylase carboxyltransferase subunit alpha [bacterium]|nr:acetyl-CoA carboxylase carboxyltransferase subunit alpha [bacterium]